MIEGCSQKVVPILFGLRRSEFKLVMNKEHALKNIITDLSRNLIFKQSTIVRHDRR